MKEIHCPRKRISPHELPVKSRMCVAALKQIKWQGIILCNLSGTAVFISSHLFDGTIFYFRKTFGGLIMESKLTAVKEQFLSELAKAENSQDLEAIRVAYLGKKGFVTELMKEM